MNMTALITGASSGIGLEIARVLAADGINIILTARRKDRLIALKNELLEKYKIKIDIFTADLSHSGSAEKLFNQIQKSNIKVDMLVNNAGFGIYGDFSGMDMSRIYQMLQLNIISLTELTHFFLPGMIERKDGYIMQISSIGAFQPAPYFAVYAATKAYVLSFGEALDHELKNSGISVTTIYPGATSTEFAEIANHKQPKLAAMTSMSPKEVAEKSVQAMMKRKRGLTTGFINQVNAGMVKMLPRKISTSLAGSLMKPKK